MKTFMSRNDMTRTKSHAVDGNGYARIAGFGAALGTLLVAPNAEATIVTLTPSPKSVAVIRSMYGAIFGQAIVNLGIPKVGGATASFRQFNSSVGKTLTGGGHFNIAGFVSALPSHNLTVNAAFVNPLRISSAAAGTRTFGFKTQAGDLGWIKMDLGGLGGSINYLAAAFDNVPGEQIHVGTLGTSAVPAPSSFSLFGLGLLALGAAGVQSHRRRRAALGGAAAG